ncbi:MAG: hypothetical protein V4441_01550 [Pseudomonadota bacterium]
MGGGVDPVVSDIGNVLVGWADIKTAGNMGFKIHHFTSSAALAADLAYLGLLP